jgi:hypothetical protein
MFSLMSHSHGSVKLTIVVVAVFLAAVAVVEATGFKTRRLADIVLETTVSDSAPFGVHAPSTVPGQVTLFLTYDPPVTTNLRPHMFGKTLSRMVEVVGCTERTLDWTDLGTPTSSGVAVFQSSPCTATGTTVRVVVPARTIKIPPGIRGVTYNVFLDAVDQTFGV